MTAKAADRLCPGERCLATGKGLNARPRPGVVESTLEKRYFIVLDGETESQPFSFKKVKRLGKPAKPQAPVVDMREFAADCNREVAEAADRMLARNQRPPTRLTIPDAQVPTIQRYDLLVVDDILPLDAPNPAARLAAYEATKQLGFTVSDARGCGFQRRDILAALTPQPRPKKPSRSEAYLQHVREHECCNCGAPGPSDPDHVGPRGVGQKCSDYLCIPLCRPCHRTRTDSNFLPDAAKSNRIEIGSTVTLLSGPETELIILSSQVQMLREWVEKQEKETT